MDRLLQPGFLGPVVAAALLFLAGLAGIADAAVGYGLFFTATLLLAGAVAAVALLTMTRWFDTRGLVASAGLLGRMGGWGYVMAVAALAGHYGHETLAGRMETRWILFGAAVLPALIVLDVGLYRRLVAGNRATWLRWRAHVRREDADPAAMRRTFVDDVVLHRSLYGVSRVRWLRHTLIFWGFTLMFATELLAVVVREGFPAFGLADVWEQPGHPLRLAFDFTYDATGAMVLAGCLLALAWRARVAGREERRFADTPTTVFLLLVVLSGFLVEGMRIAGAAPGHPHAVSFVGYAFSFVVPPARAGSGVYDALWLRHVLGSCLFIAYVPARRLVHSCATPLGRLMHSQKTLLDAKRKAVLGALMPRRS